MTASTSDFEYSRFSSRDLARLGKEPVGESFFCNAHFYRLSALSISHVAVSALRVNRTREMAEGCQELVLAMQLEGTANVSQLGRETNVPSGSAILFSDADPSYIEHTPCRVVLIGVPRAVLVPALANPDAALMSVIPGTLKPLRLLRGYIDVLIKDPALMETAELRQLAVRHVHDLVAMALGATRDAAEIAAGRGLRAARLHAIKGDIAQNLAGDVTAAALTVRHRLSPRYIRKLFESENTSLSQFVLAQRLTRVHRMLADPRYASRTISDIALAVGFGDISTFNREFRRRFNATPSDVRAAARES